MNPRTNAPPENAPLTSTLRVFAEQQPDQPLESLSDPAQIGLRLQAVGVRYERWPTDPSIAPGASQHDVLTAYADPIERLKRDGGYVTADVISLAPDHPQAAELRQKFLHEHTHAEDEVRFFAAGQGLFTLHIGTEVFELHATAGDLISVPAGTRHWFDMGPAPSFVAVRIFTNPAGWVAEFTGDDIASRFPRLAA
jgi:1,2-dihydroxy-3-keto-5-methylthiopentene dioxygenase